MHVFILILLLSISASTVADSPQEEGSEEKAASTVEAVAENPLLQEHQSLLSKMDQASKDAEQIHQQIEKTTGTEKNALELRFFQYQLNSLDLLADITANLIAQKKAGVDIGDEKAAIREKMLGVGPKISRFIANELSEYERQKNISNEESDEHYLFFKNHIEIVDIALKALSRHIEQLALLEFNNQHSRAYLTDALAQRAEWLSGSAQITKSRLDVIQEKLLSNSEERALKNEQENIKRKLDLLVVSLRKIIDLMKKAEMETTDYQSIVIQSSGEISSAMLDVDVFKQLFNRWLKKVSSAIENKGVDFILSIVVFLSIVFAFSLLAKLIKKLISKSTYLRAYNSNLLEGMLGSIVSRSIFFIGVLVALSQVGISLGPVLAGLGIAGFIVGFALQDTLSNFASGIMILVYRPYDIGDMVEAASVYGRVSNMSLVSTTIHTIDNQTLVVPNSKIWGDVIKNVTHQQIRRVDLSFQAPLSEDVDRMLGLFRNLLDTCDRVLAEPEMAVELDSIGEYALQFIVRPWVNTEDYWPTYWMLQAEVKRMYDREGIAFPIPERSIHIAESNVQSVKVA